MLFKWNQGLVDFFLQFSNVYTVFCVHDVSLTDAVCVCHAFSRYAVAPQALMHVTAGLAVLHPVIRGSGDHQEYISHSCTKQSTSHKAVHLAPTDTLTKYESILKLIQDIFPNIFKHTLITDYLKNCSKYECIKYD